MELTLRYRRWLEVRFYFWCYELYSIRYNMIDVVLAVEAIAQIADDINIAGVKNLAGNILSDPYLQCSEDEFILLAHEEEHIGITEIANHLNKQRTGMHNRYKKIVNKNMKIYPKLDIKYDILIKQFFDKLELFKNIGL